MEKLLAGEISMDSPVSKCSDTTVKQVASSSTIGQAARIVQNNDYVMVVDGGVYRRTLHRNYILAHVAQK